ncbi:MAG TPA: MBL fold metallo-hydrolase [Bacillota bacterium]|nr:MBL fold metallo-hydrolase [Bacillota bacterium]
MGELIFKYKRLFLGLALVIMMWQNVVMADTPQYPVLKNTTGKTIIERISYSDEWLSDFMIISKTGTVIIVDSYYHRTSFDSIPPDIICVTHTQHREHYDLDLLVKYNSNKKVKKSIQKVESFKVKDVNVTGIASAHGSDGKIDDQKPENVIYIFEVDGLRIADFGGTGQKELTPDQLKTLGRIDIAFMEFVDYPELAMSLDSCLNIARQLNPQIIIPTHRTETTIPEVGKLLELPVETVERLLVVNKDDLKEGEKKIIELANPLK